MDSNSATDPETHSELADLASYLSSRRQAILEGWRLAVLGDAGLETAAQISVLHFENLIPKILDKFEQRLRTASGRPPSPSEEQSSFEHGTHRWQEGYSIQEMVREWGHFQICVTDEIELYGLTRPGVPAHVPAFARRLWLMLCNEGISKSVEEFNRLQRSEAEGVFQDLQQAVTELRDLDRQRAEIWHEAAHDLRGNVGLVTTTTSILTEAGVPETLRTRAFTLLQSNVTSLQSLLEDLLSLARLEAGREELQLQTFDASALLQDMGATLGLLAQEKGLYLHTDGPESLIVEGDPAKIRRILQNLTLNALKYTEHGGITLSWGTTRERDIERWLIRVRDTGPGMPFAPGGPVTAELREATRTSKKVEERAGKKDVEPVTFFPPAFLPDGFQRPGEGVGLLIVKRLCELLQATIEVASAPGEGTVFQVVLPRDYGRSER